jgi:hypothetical protein
MFHVRNLGKKLRKFIGHCDVCQRCKHPNRSFTVERGTIYLRNKEMYVPLIYAREPAYIKWTCDYILLCRHDVFSPYIKLSP